MAFQPKAGEHAVVEVVFNATLENHIAPKDMEVLAKSHDRFKSELPRLNRSQTVELFLGEGPPPPNLQIPVPTAGVMFERIKPDGTLEWRLNVSSNSLTVNCLAYTRWGEVWPRACRHMAEAARIVGGGNQRVTNLTLQYIDIFEWHGTEEPYDIGLLLRVGTGAVPSDIGKRGVLWHLHQGWFNFSNLPYPGRQLERVHLDAVLDEQSNPIVKVDTLIRADLEQPLSNSDLFRQNGAVAEKMFSYLHDRSKEVFSDFLTEDAAKGIGLNVGT